MALPYFMVSTTTNAPDVISGIGKFCSKLPLHVTLKVFSDLIVEMVVSSVTTPEASRVL
ncbi:hypothetical protein D3C87_2118530 [compost metagenome]